jgi:hypothetical protein
MFGYDALPDRRAACRPRCVIPLKAAQFTTVLDKRYTARFTNITQLPFL